MKKEYELYYSELISLIKEIARKEQKYISEYKKIKNKIKNLLHKL